MSLTDILFAVTGSGIGNTFTIFLPVSVSVGSPIFIEAPTVYFPQTLLGKENISIF